GQLARVYEAVHGHLGHAHDGGHLGNGQEPHLTKRRLLPRLLGILLRRHVSPCPLPVRSTRRAIGLPHPAVTTRAYTLERSGTGGAKATQLLTMDSGPVGGVLTDRAHRSCSRPSSRERSRAASMAVSSAARTAWFSSSRIAEMVVPPGDVTASRSVTGCSPDSRSIFAAPTADWMISAGPTARGSRSRTRASIIAPTRKKKYAGPEPDSAVTASCCDSGTLATRPTLDSSSSTSARCEGEADAPAEIALIASPTSIGVFGMTRTTGVPAGSRRWYSLVGNPAHSATTSESGLIAGASSASSGSISWGFTATTRTSACS